MKRFIALFVLLLLAALGNERAYAVTTTDYLPLPPGNSWTFLENGSQTVTATVSSDTKTINGKVTRIIYDNFSQEDYFTNDSQGIRYHGGSRDFDESGRIYHATITFSPAIILAQQTASLGSTLNQSGTASVAIQGSGTFPLNYTSSSQVIGFENVITPYGNFTALKIHSASSVSGYIGGEYINEPGLDDTFWLVEHIGPVKYLGTIEGESGVLTGTNVQVEPATVLAPASISVPTSDPDGGFTVSWGASSTSNVTYVLQEATNATFTTGLRTAYKGSPRNAAITGRTTGKTYYYRVKATKVNMTSSPWKKAANGCLISPPCSKPASISVPASDPDGGFTVSWGKSATADVTYVLQEATNSTFSTGIRTAYKGAARSFAITGRTAGKTYYYRVKATKTGMTSSSWLKAANGCAVTASPPTTLTEQWTSNANNGQGSGNWTITKANNTVTASGNWVFSYGGMTVACPWSSGAVTISGTSVSFVGTGTATIAGIGSSPFTLTVTGNAANGQGSGTFRIQFSAYGWPASISGSWTSSRTSGSGITAS